MILNSGFFKDDVIKVADSLIGKKLIRSIAGKNIEYLITELEIYRGEEDLACHASKGKTKRTEVMYREGGIIYMYLVYGMHWMFNIVCGEKDNPQAILIRGINEIKGPGKVSKKLALNKDFNYKQLSKENNIWIENNKKYKYVKENRIGIDYAGAIWKNKKWRYILKS